jgi:hypothetical protein
MLALTAADLLLFVFCLLKPPSGMVPTTAAGLLQVSATAASTQRL